MFIQTYNSTTVELMQQPDGPGTILALALSLTMKNEPSADLPEFTSALGKYLIEAEHTSPLEHLSYTFLIQNASRSFLAQITRHRMSSFTSASQHYPMIVSAETQHDGAMVDGLITALESYEYMRGRNVPKEEARQVLPNASAVNLLWTINARSLINFLRQRLCYRNVQEMILFANKVLSLVEPTFPALFQHVGPQCYMGNCKQGKMQCKRSPWIAWRRDT